MMKRLFLSAALLTCMAPALFADEQPTPTETQSFESFVEYVRSNTDDLAQRTKRVQIHFISERPEGVTEENWSAIIRDLAQVLENHKTNQNADAARELMVDFVDVMKNIPNSQLGISFVD